MWCKQESCTARAESGLGQPADQPGPESSEAALPSRKAGAAVEEAARKRSWLDSSGEQGRQVGGTQKQALFRHSAKHSDSTLRFSQVALAIHSTLNLTLDIIIFKIFASLIGYK